MISTALNSTQQPMHILCVSTEEGEKTKNYSTKSNFKALPHWNWNVKRWKKRAQKKTWTKNGTRVIQQKRFPLKSCSRKGGMDRNGSLLCDTRLIILQITLFLEYKGKLFILSDCDRKKLKSDIWHDTELWLLFHNTKLNSRCEGLPPNPPPKKRGREGKV